MYKEQRTLTIGEAAAELGVTEIVANVAEGSTLYREAKRLNEQAVPSPGWRFKSGERKHGVSWSPTTVAGIVHQSAYSGVHRVRIGKEGCIERKVPPIVEPGLQQRAEASLAENKRRASPDRKNDRKYLLSGLVKCAVCGFACTGRTTTNRGKKYSYYGCVANRTERGAKANAARIPPHRTPHVSAPWLEDLVWQDVKQFLENPGEVLERVREQLRGESDNTEELGARREDLAKRLDAKQSEKDRYVRLYAQGHLSESELDTYLTDLKNQIDNLRLLIESVEANLSERRERIKFADTTYAWLVVLRERVAEVERDTQEAFEVRQQLVRLLVQGATLEKREGQIKVRVTYRFDPPECRDEEDGVVGDVRNSSCGNLAAKRKPSGVTSRHRSTFEPRGVP